MSRHSFSMRDRPKGSSDDYDVIIEELIKLLPLLVMVGAMYARPWIEHQLWRVKTLRERRARADQAALRQVRKDISDMEHYL